MGDSMSPSPENPISGKGGQVYGIADPKPEGNWQPRPVTTTGETAPLPPIPFPETGTTPFRKSLYQKIDNLLRSRILRIGLGLGVAGGAGLAVYQNVPAVHQSIDNAYLDIMRTIGIETVVPSTFDTKAGKTKFGENNITRITAEEAENKKLLEPTIKVDNTNTVTVTTLLPGLFPSTIPNTQINSESQAKMGEAPLVKKSFIMPEGYQLTIPKGTHYALLKPDQETNRNPDLIYTMITFFYDPVNDITLSLVHETTGLVPEDGQKTFDGNTYNKLYNPSMGGKLEDLPLSDGVTPIAKPSSANQKLDMFLYVSSGRKEPSSSLAEAIAKYKKVVWENFVDPNQKLIVTSSR